VAKQFTVNSNAIGSDFAGPGTQSRQKGKKRDLTEIKQARRIMKQREIGAHVINGEVPWGKGTVVGEKNKCLILS